MVSDDKKCPPGKIRNPKTNYCVKRDGKIGKAIIAAQKRKVSEKQRKRKKKTIKELREECRKLGLVYDRKEKKCRESKRGKRKVSSRKSPKRKVSRKQSKRKKKTIKELRAECRKLGLVYDHKEKKCRESKVGKRKSRKPSRKRKAARKPSRKRKCKHGVLKKPVILPNGRKRYCKLAPKRKSRRKSRKPSRKRKKNIIKELREECRKLGLVYDREEKKCRERKDALKWYKNIRTSAEYKWQFQRNKFLKLSEVRNNRKKYEWVDMYPQNNKALESAYSRGKNQAALGRYKWKDIRGNNPYQVLTDGQAGFRSIRRVPIITPVGIGIPTKFKNLPEECTQHDWNVKELGSDDQYIFETGEDIAKLQLQPVGYGAYGAAYVACTSSKIFSGIGENKCKYILKVQEISELDRKEIFEQEVYALTDLQSTNVVPKIHAAWICKNFGFLVIDMLEPCDIIIKYPAVMKILEKIKDRGWLHVDMHTGNLMCQGKKLVLIDFGWAVKKGEGPPWPSTKITQRYPNITWDELEAVQNLNVLENFPTNSPPLLIQAELLMKWNKIEDKYRTPFSKRKAARKKPSRKAQKKKDCIDLSKYGKTPSERKKYAKRKSPPYSAQACQGEFMFGQHEHFDIMYESRKGKKYWTWRKN